MKIASYLIKDKPGFGVVDRAGKNALDASAAFGSLRAVLENNALAELQNWASDRTADIALDDVIFLPPVPDAKRIICIGRNFEKIHPIEGRIPPPENISLFAKIPGAVVGHETPLVKPPVSDTFDYEGEIALVIGKHAANLTPDNATEVIAGITILNDGSLREWQKHSVTAGKNFVSSSSIGPWMATLDEIGTGKLSDIHLRTWLNDTLVQDVSAAEMIFDIPTILAYVTTFMPLEPGDVISTGSPEREKVPGRASPYLQAGDTVSIEIDGVGRLRNRVVAAPVND